jgi:hypothetical protein
MNTAVHRSPNKLWWSYSIFNLWLYYSGPCCSCCRCCYQRCCSQCSRCAGAPCMESLLLLGCPCCCWVSCIADFSTISCVYVSDIVTAAACVSAVGGLSFFAGFTIFVRAPALTGVLQLLASLLLLASRIGLAMYRIKFIKFKAEITWGLGPPCIGLNE